MSGGNGLFKIWGPRSISRRAGASMFTHSALQPNFGWTVADFLSVPWSPTCRKGMEGDDCWLYGYGTQRPVCPLGCNLLCLSSSYTGSEDFLLAVGKKKKTTTLISHDPRPLLGGKLSSHMEGKHSDTSRYRGFWSDLNTTSVALIPALQTAGFHRMNACAALYDKPAVEQEASCWLCSRVFESTSVICPPSPLQPTSWGASDRHLIHL